MDFRFWVESSLADLYSSTVEAFPRTTRRQHSIDPIRIERMDWTPYLGVRTLFVKGLANSNGKHYKPIILFKSVAYGEANDPNLVELVASNGQHYWLNPLSYENNDVLVRCDCPDLRWRGLHYLRTDHNGPSLYGRDRLPYERKTPPPPDGYPYANPLEMPMMCKHIIKFSKVIRESGILI